MADSDTWRDFDAQFMELAKEGSALLKSNRGDRGLEAHRDYTRVTWDLMYTEEGYPFCPLGDRPACGRWVLSDGPNENFRARFERVATRAGIALGPPPGTKPLIFWLHRLFLDLVENKSPGLFGRGKDQGGIILKVCEASATYLKP